MDLLLEYEEVLMVCPLDGRVKTSIYDDLVIDFSELKSNGYAKIELLRE